MKYKKLGHLREVSVLGFGSASISGEGGGYGFGDITTQDAIRLLHRALEAGITLFDTAPIYGFGLAEQRLGKAFAERRDEVFYVSKSGVAWDNSKRVGVDNSPETTQRMLEQSLRDLKTECIDLYLIHWPDSNVDIRRPVEVLARAKEEGKIGAWGLSNTYPEDIAKAQEIDRVDVIQGQFNLFERYPKEAYFSMIREHEMGFMSWGTLDKGILTGRVHRERQEFDASDVRSHAAWWKEANREPKYEAMEAIMPLLKDTGHSGLEMALAFVLGHEEVSTALCGVRNDRQLDSALAALENLPNAEVMAEVEEIAQRKFFAEKEG